ncbi:glycoside hydrolase family 3 N-terminal domain-containing protein [Boudabousia marimammalium]|uniref:beta-N-acetylhexosaminidase n=1 Tax=Boudabousia marimammalium TaxID=156892 RepID=A0A1Q5PRT7_9ACTO|nr:glycoside hydrolase family 3 N-terminal domain-containing protein [Boudabousia marimammalium]OKL50276.1 hypothetical protein BM477_02490 [Boudabousia marimammalium]
MLSSYFHSKYSLRNKLLASVAISGIVFTGLGFVTPTATAAESTHFSGATSSAVKTANTDPHERAVALRNQMSLDEKLGQLIWTHVYGSDANQVTEKQAASNEAVFGTGITTPAAAIQHWKLGGVLYFNWSDNIGRPADLQQIASLSNGLQDAARATGTGVPLAITVDQEGGLVARLRGSTTDFPGNMALGATRSTELAQQQGVVMGRELKAVGINVDFAPVADVNTNPQNPVIGIRSIGSDPKLVADLTKAQVLGLQSEGVSATAKHFPGHGDTSSDSHTSLPVVNYDRATLDQHLEPFRAAIAAETDMIMTAHVIVKAIDPQQPATLSKAVLTDLLRDEMGFQGIITTDAIDMEGAQLAVMTEEEIQHYNDWKCKGTTSINGGKNTAPENAEACIDLMKKIRGEVTVKAVAAGSDIVLNTYDVSASVEALKTALQDGTLSEDHINASVDRVLEWKARRGVLDSPNADLSQIDTTVKNGEAKYIASQISSLATTLVRNKNQVLPLPAGAKVLVTGSTYGNPEKLEPRLANFGFRTSYETTKKLNPTDEEIAKQVAAASNVDYIIYTAYRAYTSTQQQKAVKALAETGKPVIVVVTHVPYDSAALPQANAVLNIYGNQDPNHEGAARALTGLISPRGSLPVSVPAIAGIEGSRSLPYGYSLTYPSRVPVIDRALAPAPEEAPFQDVPVNRTFAGEINWLKTTGISTGWDDNTFHPLEGISREAFAAFLYRLIDSKPGATQMDLHEDITSPFMDYQNGKFSNEVAHVARLGIIKGWPDGTFRPEEKISREAVAAMLHRMCEETRFVCATGLNTLPVPEVSGNVFSDVPAGAMFAADIQWFKQTQITTGYPDFTFRPQEPVHRDAIAAFLYRLTKNRIR